MLLLTEKNKTNHQYLTYPWPYLDAAALLEIWTRLFSSKQGGKLDKCRVIDADWFLLNSLQSPLSKAPDTYCYHIYTNVLLVHFFSLPSPDHCTLTWGGCKKWKTEIVVTPQPPCQAFDHTFVHWDKDRHETCAHTKEKEEKKKYSGERHLGRSHSGFGKVMSDFDKIKCNSRRVGCPFVAGESYWWLSRIEADRVMVLGGGERRSTDHTCRWENGKTANAHAVTTATLVGRIAAERCIFLGARNTWVLYTMWAWMQLCLHVCQSYRVDRNYSNVSLWCAQDGYSSFSALGLLLSLCTCIAHYFLYRANLVICALLNAQPSIRGIQVRILGGGTASGVHFTP